MIALFAALLAATAIHSGNVNALVDHVLDAYGGAAAWSNVYVLRESGTVVPAMASGNGSNPYLETARFLARGDRLFLAHGNADR